MPQRISTLDEYQKQMYFIIEYINNHLDSTIDLTKLAALSHFSPFHFHRITRAFLGEPIGAYILRIRLETAAKLIRYSDLPINIIAERIGYDAASSLSKAFKQFYGISPTEYRTNKNHSIMKTSQTEVTLNIKKAKILELPVRKVIYIKLIGEYKQLDFAGSWQSLWQFVKENKLYSAGIEHLAIYHDDPHVTEAAKLRTDICLVVQKEATPQGKVGVKELNAGKFALFLYQGSYEHLDRVYNEIYSKLLPESGLKLRDEHCFEKYINNPNQTAPEKLKTEIYIPIE